MEEQIESLVAAEVNKRLSDPSYLQGQILRFIEDRKRLTEAVQSRERELEALAPVKAFYDAVTEPEGWMEMAAAVKVLAIPGCGRNKTFALLRDRQIFRHNNEPYQQYVEHGYFKTAEELFEDACGRNGVYRKTLVSNKGLDFIRKVIGAETGG